MLVRSIVLRGFDQQMANIVTESMQQRGVNFHFRCIPKSVEKLENGRLLAKWTKTDDPTQEFSDEFDTVLFAVGRRALTRELNLEKAGVKIAGEGEKIDAVNEQTNVPHIYAVGDVLYVSSCLTVHFCRFNFKNKFIISVSPTEKTRANSSSHSRWSSLGQTPFRQQQNPNALHECCDDCLQPFGIR